ncbi:MULTISPECIES: DUF6584 family protein [unclassified Streptomyces]|uniref:DUF6584 family protein n=1 Tax=unclassified Streptomyces TaxID=2593676 RepID=UPI0005F92831|nr:MULTISPECIES: DUF6584 family protein [unclassified Streptomyces]KJY26650.1 hypothetical protein VR45_36575 [Streptomyces sp. NRRL S-495]
MTVETTLVKVDADLRAGRIPVARQRLRGLVASYPADLTARQRLAEVYRLYGESAEAGRWAYLDVDRDPGETAAFEARHPDPLDRMVAVAWRGPEESAPTDTARARLAGLREAASAQAGRPIHWHHVRDHAENTEHSDSDDSAGKLFCAGLALAALVLLGFAALGVATFVRWWL